MPPPLTILHLVSLRGIGGRAATALRQARLLAARGHRVLLGCLAGSTAETRGRELGLQVHAEFHFSRGFRPWHFWSDCRRVSALCNAHQVDVLHTHVSQETWVGCLGARLAARRPLVMRSRGVVVPIKPHGFNRWMHNRLSDGVIAPSQVIYDRLRALPGFDTGKVFLLHEGVDLSRFAPNLDGKQVRQEFGVPDDAPLVVMVARLEKVKGHEIFFQALADLRRGGKIPALRALCACDERTAGAYDTTVRRARELGLDEQMLAFTGMRSDIERILAAANLVALPSLGSEGSSRVALEAAGCAVPVIASTVGCLPEVIVEGNTGLLVPPGDPQALAQAILSLAQQPEQARNLGRAARRRAEENYDEQQMVEHLEALYRQQLAKRDGVNNPAAVQESPR